MHVQLGAIALDAKNSELKQWHLVKIKRLSESELQHWLRSGSDGKHWSRKNTINFVGTMRGVLVTWLLLLLDRREVGGDAGF